MGSKKERKILWKLAVVAVLGLAAAGWIAREFYNVVTQPIGEHKHFEVITIPQGASLTQIGLILSDAGLSPEVSGLPFREEITQKWLFLLASGAMGTDNLKYGEYRLHTRMSLADILKKLGKGEILTHTFTIPEGFTLEEITELLEKKSLANRETFLEAVNDEELRNNLGIISNSIEGFLFPDTYKVARGINAREIVDITTDRFIEIMGEVLPAASTDDPADPTPTTVPLAACTYSIAGSQYTLYDIVTIASIIEKETSVDVERPTIGAVIYNRLKRGMKLQCDTTIRYPLQNYGVHLTYADLKMDSPYNSYIHSGLPPTPICNPGLASLKAALNPSDDNYLYFVSRNNGTHKFSSTLKEHNRAVRKYQKNSRS